MLKQHGQRVLPALEAHQNVGELRWHTAHGGGRGLVAHAGRAIEGGLRCLCLTQLPDVRGQDIGPQPALLGEDLVIVRAGLAARLQCSRGTLDAGHHGLFSAGHSGAGRSGTCIQGRQPTSSLPPRLGHVLRHIAGALTDLIKPSSGARAVDFGLDLNLAAICAHAQASS
ncbi:hypothetical protein [Comamonas aquatica]|uniref:hypothetical protein n=1 Tax=Comamonas aquatica TaxID=225991 RepID=UPI001E6110C3|nr:hypothetical protein [Comamonas aquatica]